MSAKVLKALEATIEIQIKAFFVDFAKNHLILPKNSLILLVLVLVFIELLGDPVTQSDIWIANKYYKQTNPLSNKHMIELLVI